MCEHQRLSSFLLTIPEDIIFKYISSFISEDEWKNFQCLNVEFFHHWKKTRILHLSQKHTVRYFCDQEFQNKVLKVIENPEKQLSIAFTNQVEIILKNMRFHFFTLRLSNGFCNPLQPMFMKQLSIQLKNETSVDLSFFRNLEELRIDSSEMCTITGHDHLHSIKSIFLSRCTVRDVRSWTNIESVRLLRSVIEHISGANLKFLRYNDYKCTKFDDLMSQFQLNPKTLVDLHISISNHVDLASFSCLQNLEFLSFSFVDSTGASFVPFPKFPKLIILTLSGACFNTDFSSIPQLNRLNLSNCSEITGVAGLTQLEYLSIICKEDCPISTGLDDLQNLIWLQLIGEVKYPKYFQDFLSLRKMRNHYFKLIVDRSNIDYCSLTNQITVLHIEGSPFPTLREQISSTVHSSSQIQLPRINPSGLSFPFLTELTLKDCDDIDHVILPETVNLLSIDGLFNLLRIEVPASVKKRADGLLGIVKCCLVRNCEQLTEIRLARTVAALNIAFCPVLKTIQTTLGTSILRMDCEAIHSQSN